MPLLFNVPENLIVSGSLVIQRFPCRGIVVVLLYPGEECGIRGGQALRRTCVCPCFGKFAPFAAAVICAVTIETDAEFVGAAWEITVNKSRHGEMLNVFHGSKLCVLRYERDGIGICGRIDLY